MNIFEIAARKKYRFPSGKGPLTAEQLFELPLTSNASATSLDAVARAVNAELKANTEESFVEVKSNPLKGDLEVKLEIVKHIISYKQATIADAAKRAVKSEERRKLLDAIANKKDEALSQASMDDLEKQLAALDAD